MTDWDYSQPWYHGSQQELAVIRAGSSISQNRDVARVFSHRPSLVSTLDDGTRKHNGTENGYLYLIAEEVKAEDVYPHPHTVNVGYWEWLTTRALNVQLIERPAVRAAESLTDEDVAELRRKQVAVGAETFAA